MALMEAEMTSPKIPFCVFCLLSRAHINLVHSSNRLSETQPNRSSQPSWGCRRERARVRARFSAAKLIEAMLWWTPIQSRYAGVLSNF